MRNFLTIILLLLFSCTAVNDPLVGKWRRFGDVFEGMEIDIVKQETGFIATLSVVPDHPEASGFVIGDRKWRDIRKVSKRAYEYEDLGKRRNKSSGRITSTSYSETSLLISENGDTLHTRDFVKSNQPIGFIQKWIRVK